MKDLHPCLPPPGRNPDEQHGCINAPVYRASTILFPTLEEWETRHKGEKQAVVYGTVGTPTTFALADAVAQLEGGFGAVVCSSGLAAVALTLSSLLAAGSFADDRLGVWPRAQVLPDRA